MSIIWTWRSVKMLATMTKCHCEIYIFVMRDLCRTCYNYFCILVRFNQSLVDIPFLRWVNSEHLYLSIQWIRICVYWNSMPMGQRNEIWKRNSRFIPMETWLTLMVVNRKAMAKMIINFSINLNPTIRCFGWKIDEIKQLVSLLNEATK